MYQVHLHHIREHLDLQLIILMSVFKEVKGVLQVKFLQVQVKVQEFLGVLLAWLQLIVQLVILV